MNEASDHLVRADDFADDAMGVRRVTVDARAKVGETQAVVRGSADSGPATARVEELASVHGGRYEDRGLNRWAVWFETGAAGAGDGWWL